MKLEIKRKIYRFFVFKFLKYYYDCYYVIGEKKRLHIGTRSAVANTLFNVASGTITIGNRTIMGQNVMIITGRHQFENGKRISLNPMFDDGSWGGNEEVPKFGFDIKIGDGVFIGSGAIILGPCEIGDHSIIAAGSVVNKDFPHHSFIAGVPAELKRKTF